MVVSFGSAWLQREVRTFAALESALLTSPLTLAFSWDFNDCIAYHVASPCVMSRCVYI